MNPMNKWPLAVAAVLALLAVGEARLDGNETDAERRAQRTTRDVRISVWPVTAGPMSNGCVGLYERSVLYAYHQYESCLDLRNDTFWWNLMFTNYCTAEYLLRSQQYIFQFVSCMAIR